MLSKEICYKCCKKHSDRRWFRTAWFNEDWDYFGVVACSMEIPGEERSAGVGIDVKGEIPDWCPYTTEHCVSDRC